MNTENTNSESTPPAITSFSRSQCRIIAAEMIADGLAVDDRSERAAQVAHTITSVPLMKWLRDGLSGTVSFEVWLQSRQPFTCRRPPGQRLTADRRARASAISALAVLRGWLRGQILHDVPHAPRCYRPEQHEVVEVRTSRGVKPGDAPLNEAMIASPEGAATLYVAVRPS